MSRGPGDGTEIRVLICERNHRCIAAARHHTQTPSGRLSPDGEDLTPAHLKEVHGNLVFCFCFFCFLSIYFFHTELSLLVPTVLLSPLWFYSVLPLAQERKSVVKVGKGFCIC